MSAGGLWLAFRGLDIKAVLKSMAQADLIQVLGAGIVYLAAFLARSLRWKLLLAPLGSLTFARGFTSLMYGFFINNVLPMRAGEFARAALVAGWLSASAATCLGAVVAERLSDLMALLILAVWASLKAPAAELPLVSLAVTLSGGLASVGILVRFRHRLSALTGRSPWLDKSVGALERLAAGLASLRGRRQLPSVLGLTLVIWALDLATLLTLSRAYGIPLSPVQSAMLIVGLALGVMLPAAPGYIGTYEYFGKATLVLMGIPAPAALSFVVSLHAFQMIVIAAIGAPTLARFGVPKLPRKNQQAGLKGNPGLFHGEASQGR